MCNAYICAVIRADRSVRGWQPLNQQLVGGMTFGARLHIGRQLLTDCARRLRRT